MKRTCVWLAVCLGCLAAEALGQTADEASKVRRYDQGPLRAEDFAAEVPADRGNRQASTYSRIRYNFQYRGTISSKSTRIVATQIESFAVQMPGKSWNAAPKDAALLDHEQGHFDITQLYAIHWRRHAEGLIAKSALVGEGASKELANENLLARCQKEIESIDAALQAEQLRYDRETNHGQDRQRQAQWRVRLNRELAAAKSTTQ